MANVDFYDGKREFVKEFTSILEEISEKDLLESPIKRWAAYCLTTKKLDVDIDVSKWAIYSYVEKYEFLKEGDVRKQNRNNKNGYKFEILLGDHIYRGDTMTSYANFIRRYYILKYNLRNIGKKSCAGKVLSGRIPEDYMVKLANLVHTKGNLIPVPLCFNAERSGSYADCDYWDIVMYCIFKWCNTSDDKYLYELLNRYNSNNHTAESILYFKDWMKNFNNNWSEFVKKNYLKAFVDSSSEVWYPKEFWKNHFAFNRKISELSLDEFRDSVQLICDCIEERNKEVN